jgi:hypothetical protein
MLMFTGKVAEKIAEMERMKKEIIGDKKLREMTEDEQLTLYQIIDIMQTFPFMIDIFYALEVSLIIKGAIDPKGINTLISKIRDVTLADIDQTFNEKTNNRA